MNKPVEAKLTSGALSREGRSSSEAGKPQFSPQDLFDFLEEGALGLQSVGADGVVLWANAAMYETLGYRAEEYIGQPIARFHVDTDIHQELRRRLREGETLRNHAVRMRHKDGSIRHVRVTTSAAFDAQGRYLHTRCFVRDVSEQVIAESHLRRALEATPDATLVVNREWRCEYLNRVACDLSVLPLSRALESTVWEVLPDLRDPDARRMLHEAMQRREALPAVEVCHKARKRWFDLDAIPHEEGLVLVLRDINDRKRHVEQLQQAETLHRLTTEQAPFGIVRAQVDGTLTEVNPAFCTILGYSAEELIGRKIYEFIYAEDRALDQAHAARVIESRLDSYSSELRYVRKDGSLLWVKVTANAIRNAEGEILFALGLVENIHEARLAGEERRKSEQHFRILTRMSPVGMFRADAQGNYVYVNEEWSRITGITSAEALGMGWQRSIHPDDQKSAIACWQAALNAQQPFRREYRCLRPDGKKVWVLAQAAEARDRHGEPVFIGTITDISDHIEAERHRSRLAAIVSSSADAICIADPDGTFAAWNRGAERMFGYAAEDVLGSPVTRLAPPGRKSEVVALFEKALRGEAIQEFEAERKTKDGRLIPVSISISPVLDSSGKVTAVSSILRDITQRKKSEAEAERVAREREGLLQDLQRTVHFYNMFIGVLSHDLRNPLGAIMMGAQVGQMHTRDEKEKKIFSRILSSSERMARMIEQLLDVTRIRAGNGLVLKRGEVDLKAVCRQIIGEVRTTHGDCKIQLKVIGSALGFWDADRLAQALSNLIGNAIQHASGPPVVQLEIDGDDDDRVRFSVRNEGAIAQSLVPTIFDPFRRAEHASRKTAGLGLGLYITKEIAEAHGGEVRLHSSEVSGTTFTIELPRQLQAPASVFPVRKAQGEESRRQETLIRGE